MGKIKLILRVLPFLLGPTMFLYKLVLGVGNELIILNSPKIESVSHLERLIEEKKKEAGFNGKIIAKIDLTEDITDRAGSRKINSPMINENSYEIIINKDYLKTKVLDHELYHIFSGHCDNMLKGFIDRNIESLKYLFYQEPKTMIHTLTN